MRRARILLILGIWIAVLPYLGFPNSWKGTLTTLSGLALMYFSYVYYKESRTKEEPPKKFDNFSENQHFVKVRSESETVIVTPADGQNL